MSSINGFLRWSSTIVPHPAHDVSGAHWSTLRSWKIRIQINWSTYSAVIRCIVLTVRARQHVETREISRLAHSEKKNKKWGLFSMHFVMLRVKENLYIVNSWLSYTSCAFWLFDRDFREFVCLIAWKCIVRIYHLLWKKNGRRERRGQKKGRKPFRTSTSGPNGADSLHFCFKFLFLFALFFRSLVQSGKPSVDMVNTIVVVLVIVFPGSLYFLGIFFSGCIMLSVFREKDDKLNVDIIEKDAKSVEFNFEHFQLFTFTLFSYTDGEKMW